MKQTRRINKVYRLLLLLFANLHKFHKEELLLIIIFLKGTKKRIKEQ